MATNELQLFDFNSHNIRVMEIDGDRSRRYPAYDAHAGGARRRQRNFTSVVDMTIS